MLFTAFINDQIKPNTTAETSSGTAQQERLLKSTGRLEASNRRLEQSHQLAIESEEIGTGVLRDLKGQREQIERTRGTLDEADGYVDKSIKTLKDMGKRWLLLTQLD
jgi:vesicle transport through interaction with t-SNAREs 1